MEYKSITFKEFQGDPRAFVKPKSLVWIAKTGKRKRAYYELYCGFDIETYTKPSNHCAYMYIWQFSIYGEDNIIVYGRTWSEFVMFIDILKKLLPLDSEHRLIVWDFNFSYEFQFIRRWFKWSKMFAKEKRQPLYAFIDDAIEFRDAQAITGGSLAFLAKNYTSIEKRPGEELDYTVERNYKTPLNETQLRYCLTDVAILAEFSQYIFETYIKPQRFIPLTKTGLLRREVKKAMGKNFNIKREIYRCYPDNFNLYSELMQWCFRGGYTHTNLYHAGRVVSGIHARDITSSYPYVMLAEEGFPVSPLKSVNPVEFDKYINNDKYCIMFRAIFTGIKAKTTHSYESKSKCITIAKNSIIDNGRIRKSAMIDTWLTEVDYHLYCAFYTWTSMKVMYMYVSLRGRLPKYLLMPLAHAYQKKAEMKKAGLGDTPEYSNYKSLVNSAYGMCCTRLVTSEVKMSQLTYEWYLDGSEFDYEKERKKAFLLPQWAIYICALARARICSAILACGDDSIYTDTDSIKYLGDHEEYFNMVNKMTREKMFKTCALLGLDPVYFDDLGSFETEYGGREVKGKFLGAKRYIITDEGKDLVTIAGLPKGTLQKYCKDNNLNIYDVFSDGMIMDLNVSCKNAHTYNDKPHQDWIAGELCAELSSVGIYPIDFTMKLDRYYMHLINNMLEERRPYEIRVY